MKSNMVIIGLILSLLTAANLFFYDRVVKNNSYIMVCVGGGIFYLVTGLFLMIKNQSKTEVVHFFNTPSNLINLVLYIITMSFSYVWFYITKKRNVELSSIYDILYIPILVTFGVLFSDKKIDSKFLIGSLFIIVGILLISKQ